VPPGTRESRQPNDALRIDDHRKLHENNGIQSDIAMYDDSRRLQRGG
jgi:hypothetical protein